MRFAIACGKKKRKGENEIDIFYIGPAFLS